MQAPLAEKGSHESALLQKGQNLRRNSAAKIDAAEGQKFEGQIRRLPSWLGRSYGTTLFAVFSTVHICFVSHAAFRSTNAFFLDEYRRNTLQALICAAPTPR